VEKVENTGYVGNYKGEGSYDKKKWKHENHELKTDV
jgi:hypothetical protein